MFVEALRHLRYLLLHPGSFCRSQSPRVPSRYHGKLYQNESFDTELKPGAISIRNNLLSFWNYACARKHKKPV